MELMNGDGGLEKGGRAGWGRGEMRGSVRGGSNFIGHSSLISYSFVSLCYFLFSAIFFLSFPYTSISILEEWVTKELKPEASNGQQQGNKRGGP